jgi:hypothetical protein
MSIVAVLLGCLLLWFVATSPRFRKTVVVLGIFAAIGGGVWYLQDREPPESQSRKFAAQPPVSYADQMEIPANELTVTGIAIHRPDASGKNYKISGRIRNSAKSATLTSVKMEITVSDCRSQTRCSVVGENTVRIRADVPPGETKDFEHELTRLRGLPGRDDLSWKWTITASYAK